MWYSRRKSTYCTKFPMETIDLQAIKEIFGKNSFIGYSCYISRGLPSDTFTIEILLELPEIWILLHRAVGSHFAYTEQSTNNGSYVLAIGLVCVGGSTTPILMSYEHEQKH